MKITVKQLVRGAVIAALYTVLTTLTAPISFGPIQFRISEALTVLPFIMPEAVLGLTVGCFISNLLVSNIFDIIFGTLATFVAALITSRIKKMWLVPLPAVIANALIVGFVVTTMTMKFSLYVFAVTALSIGISELMVCYCLGIPLLVLINGMSSKIGFFK